MTLGGDVRRLLHTMLPLLAAQMSTMGMTFVNCVMAGHVSADDLAGVSVGAGLFMPIVASCMGVLTVGTPMIAQLLGGGKQEDIPRIVRTGLYLGFLLAVCITSGYVWGIDDVLATLGLTDTVRFIARKYMDALLPSVFFISLVMPLRSLTDTVGSTSVSMRLFLLALPLHVWLNWLFVYGKWGLPALGGIGAGVAMSLTYGSLLCLFVTVSWRTKAFRGKDIFGHGFTKREDWAEYLRLGIPNGLGIFMETSLFGFIILFMTRFGTVVLAAHQAAMNFSTMIYMIPMSCSMAMTILIGIEVGAGRWERARRLSRIGLGMTVACSVLTVTFTVCAREWVGFLYTSDREVLEMASIFLLYCAGWQFFDAIAAPVQGILRGYKDTTVPFLLMMAAYWGICMPLGIFLDNVMGFGPTAYWQGLVIGVGMTALFLSARLLYRERQIKRSSASF